MSIIQYIGIHLSEFKRKSYVSKVAQDETAEPEKNREDRSSVLGRGGLDLIGLGVSIGRGPEGP